VLIYNQAIIGCRRIWCSLELKVGSLLEGQPRCSVDRLVGGHGKDRKDGG
jgi:hypothetical protein